MPKYTFRRVQFGSWGSTELKNTITVEAQNEREAEAIVGFRKDCRKHLRNGDKLGWRLERERWEVTQDGAVFYVKPGDEELVDVYRYPWPVADGDLDGARHARTWFVRNIVPAEGVEVVWKE